MDAGVFDADAFEDEPAAPFDEAPFDEAPFDEAPFDEEPEAPFDEGPLVEDSFEVPFDDVGFELDVPCWPAPLLSCCTACSFGAAAPGCPVDGCALALAAAYKASKAAALRRNGYEKRIAFDRGMVHS
ncbi:hypothetical protein [Bordetella genomosp. 13]|uniref:hypothetical protein n=1 Tax=Bordetella genomosp. 13 TaxID=463040 RepID=UPI001643278E|nr:hypothetical protein [Bordetella genomosp. 13]